MKKTPIPKKPIRDTPEKQHARFVEAAKNAGADETPDAMDKAIKQLRLTRKSR